MNAEKYRQVLTNHAIPPGMQKEWQTNKNGFIFQHDNDGKHTANALKSYL